MNLTLEQFLKKNKKLKFFDEDSAKDYYYCMSSQNFPPAKAILIDALIKKIGLLDLNLGLNSLPDFILYAPHNIQMELLESRIDDFIVKLNTIKALNDIHGSYLLSDIIVYNSDNTYSLAKEKEIVYMMTLDATIHKEASLNDILLDVSSNKNNTSLDFILRLLIYITYLSKIRNLKGQASFILKLCIKTYEPLKEKLDLYYKYLTLHMNHDTKIVSRFNLLKDKDITEIALFLKSHKNKAYFHDLFDMLDIF